MLVETPRREHGGHWRDLDSGDVGWGDGVVDSTRSDEDTVVIDGRVENLNAADGDGVGYMGLLVRRDGATRLVGGGRGVYARALIVLLWIRHVCNRFLFVNLLLLFS